MTTESRQHEIEKIAYGIWEKEGRPDGREFDHFTQAEKILREGLTATPAKPEAAGKPSTRKVAAKKAGAAKTAAKKPVASSRRSKKTSAS